MWTKMTHPSTEKKGEGVEEDQKLHSHQLDQNEDGNKGLNVYLEL